ncbi:TPA: hypothetical protein DIV48_00350 [Candidatus Kaiserbacteria bacterium]|nr:MAG: hypothetical protein UY93_C0002G0235 [Parcubacteria group bacterium GW2011_GWA1_56_13]KKW46057.1 MAG: hypothetical protein UY97_C0011G0025 [Parcubacteria group bacterium GW2011_GWB1_57_6]HCR52082.1 hypothetical protein [Candidatus Kaiserbacteria bacterium]
MERKPEKVRQAQLADDTEKLSKMGAEGGIRAGLRRAYKKTLEKEEFSQREKLYHVNEEGDVLPPDPNIVLALEEKSREMH